MLSQIVDPAKTLVAVWIGINDISDSAKLAVDFATYYDQLIGTVFEQSVAPLRRAGYRRFLFVNLPPLNRSPPNLVRAAGPLPNSTMIGLWNAALDRHSAQFAAGGGVVSMVYDANTFLNQVLDNAASYGITNTTNFCPKMNQPLPVEQYGCLPLEDYFWYDNGHM